MNKEIQKTKIKIAKLLNPELSEEFIGDILQAIDEPSTTFKFKEIDPSKDDK